MSRYIDADHAEFRLQCCGTYHGVIAFDTVKAVLNKAPSIDIVFCKECKKANTEHCSHSYWDDDWGEWRVDYRGDDWFCADGEREGE